MKIMSDMKGILTSKNEVYRLALETYGKEVQTTIVFEEMAELQKELCKEARGRNNTSAIAEEIADVQIMLEQMMLLHGCEGAVKTFEQYKLRRLAERLGFEYSEEARTL